MLWFAWKCLLLTSLPAICVVLFLSLIRNQFSYRNPAAFAAGYIYALTARVAR